MYDDACEVPDGYVYLVIAPGEVHDKHVDAFDGGGLALLHAESRGISFDAARTD